VRLCGSAGILPALLTQDPTALNLAFELAPRRRSDFLPNVAWLRANLARAFSAVGGTPEALSKRLPTSAFASRTNSCACSEMFTEQGPCFLRNCPYYYFVRIAKNSQRHQAVALDLTDRLIRSASLAGRDRLTQGPSPITNHGSPSAQLDTESQTVLLASHRKHSKTPLPARQFFKVFERGSCHSKVTDQHSPSTIHPTNHKSRVTSHASPLQPVTACQTVSLVTPGKHSKTPSPARHRFEGVLQGFHPGITNHRPLFTISPTSHAFPRPHQSPLTNPQSRITSHPQ
jgi:hypothetical protein